MNISHEKKFIFVSVQKTASVSIRMNLRDFSDIGSGEHFLDPQPPHITINQIKEKFFPNNDDVFNCYFKFAFVRNPWDRMVSWYKFFGKEINRYESGEPCIGMRRIIEKHPLKGQTNVSLYDIYKYFSSMGFKDWIKYEYNKKLSYYLGGYGRYFEDKNGNNLMNFIGKIENLQQDFDFACDKIGIPRQKLEVRNFTVHDHYSEYYDDQTQQIIAEAYEKDIKNFGYKFGE